MFDDLREDTKTSYEEENYQPTTTASARPRSKRILGMTSMQQFVITFLLMLAVCVIGAMALIVAGKVGF